MIIQCVKKDGNILPDFDLKDAGILILVGSDCRVVL
jgi:hypothetical protein